MDRLLKAVLAGEWPISAAVQWLKGDTGASPPPELISWASDSAWQAQRPTPESFRADVLNFIRDQAEYVLKATEKKASTSRGGTPHTNATNSAAGTASRSPKLTADNEHRRHLETVARRLEPGAIDDANFPSLGAVKPRSDVQKKQEGRRTLPIASTPSHASRFAASTSGGGSGSGNGTPKRRIQPTQVAEVEVSTQFVTAQMSSEPAPTAAGKR